MLLQRNVPTLMSPYLTLLLSAQVSLPPNPPPPTPCPLIYNTPSGCQAEGHNCSSGRGVEVEVEEGGWGCSLFPFSPHCLSLFMTCPHDRGQGATPGRVWSPRYIGDCDLAKCGSSLTDYKTIVALPSLQSGVGWVKIWLSEGYHRITHQVCP